MKKNRICILAVILCVIFSVGVVAALAEDDPSIEGTVLYVAQDDIMVKMENGNVFNFHMQGVSESGVAIGDEVKVSYSGDILNCPEATNLEITMVDPVQTLSGRVVMHDESAVFIEINSTDVYGFLITKDTVIEGLAEEIHNGDTLNITYEGDILDGPPATQILVTALDTSNTSEAAPAVEDTTNKHLNGKVVSLKGSKIKITTSKNKSYTFPIVKSTKIYDSSYKLEVGCKVKIVYDGYASKNPNAKSIKVIAPKDPTPKPTKSPITKHTVSGKVKFFEGMQLGLTNGYVFDVAYAKIGGNGDRVPGERAKVTYYEKGGELYATKIIFKKPKK